MSQSIAAKAIFQPQPPCSQNEHSAATIDGWSRPEIQAGSPPLRLQQEDLQERQMDPDERILPKPLTLSESGVAIASNVSMDLEICMDIDVLSKGSVFFVEG